MDLNFPVFATGVRIFRASNDVGSLFLGPGSTRILEINTSTSPENTYPPYPEIEGTFLINIHHI
jgi:hypothetical protein